MTSFAGLIIPISFFKLLKFIPHFPPVAASTAPSRVVDMFTKSMPRLNVEAAKAPISVTIPPPRFISNDLRVAQLSDSCCQIFDNVDKFLFSSPSGMIKIWFSGILIVLSIMCKQCFAVPLSVSRNICDGSYRATHSLSARSISIVIFILRLKIRFVLLFYISFAKLL